MKQRNNLITNAVFFKTKDIIPRAAGSRYFTLYPEANYALYHVLGAWEAAGCTLPSLNTDFRTGQCRYFFSGRNEFVYWAKVGHATHTCWQQWHSKEPVFMCFLSLHTAAVYLDMWNMHHITDKRTTRQLQKNATCRAFFFAEMSTCALRRWSPLTSVKVNKSKSFSIFNCVPPMSTPSCLEARCVMLFSQNDFRGRSSGLSLSIFLPSLSITLSLPPSLSSSDETTGSLLFQQIPKSPEAVTPPPRGCLGVLSGRGEEAHLPEMRMSIRQLCCRLLFKLFVFYIHVLKNTLMMQTVSCLVEKNVNIPVEEDAAL